MEKKQIIEVIFDSIDDLNDQLSDDKQLTKSEDTILFGEKGQLDSLGLVNLIVAIEQNMEDTFDISITLADEKAMSQAKSPFRNVDTMAEYILKITEELD